MLSTPRDLSSSWALMRSKKLVMWADSIQMFLITMGLNPCKLCPTHTGRMPRRSYIPGLLLCQREWGEERATFSALTAPCQQLFIMRLWLTFLHYSSSLAYAGIEQPFP